MSSEPPWPDGVGRIVLPRVDSTMAEARRRACGLTAPTWILAAEQTDARGRQGRHWAMPRGNFAATLAMPAPADPASAALRSFAASLALRDALGALTGAADRIHLKWPNDVLLDGGKLAGILLELTGGILLVGIGVNLAAAPDAAEVAPGAFRPVCLRGATGAEIAPAALLDALAPRFADREGALAAEGFAALRAPWLAGATHLGAEIRARTATEELTGIFETVDEAGHLVLATQDGRRAIAAADVYF